jgi:hypothetical protein
MAKYTHDAIMNTFTEMINEMLSTRSQSLSL